MKSKRCALRFLCGNQLVRYKTAYNAGEAQLQNISTAGCAFAELSLPLMLDEKILISIELPDADRVFQAQGVVVRVEKERCTAIHFTLLEPEDQSLVRNHFTKLMRTK
jgi:hypothetical protein